MVEPKDSLTLRIVAASVIGYATYRFLTRSTRLKPGLREMPGPRQYPLVGCIEVMRAIVSGKIHEVGEKYAELYGPIFTTSLLGITTVSISDAESARQILNDSSVYQQLDRFNNVATGLLDYALFILPHGPMHAAHRKLLQPAFGPSHLRKVANNSIETSAVLVDILTRKNTIDVNRMMSAATLDIFGQVAFGTNLGALTGDLDPIWLKLNEITLIPLMKRIGIPRFLWNICGVGNKSKKLQEGRKELDVMMRKMAERCQVVIDEERMSGVKLDEGKLNVLQLLLLAKENGEMSDDEVYGELLGLLIAGHETSSNSIAWALFELCRNPRIQEKLYREIKDVNLAERSNVVAFLSTLTYLDFVLKESQRLHSTVGSAARVTVQPTTILGYHIPAGVRIMTSFRAIHRSSRYYKDPLIFHPERWEQTHNLSAFLPYGDGARKCIGFKMANIEMKVILLTLVQNFTFKVNEGSNIVFRTSVTHSVQGFMADVVPR